MTDKLCLLSLPEIGSTVKRTVSYLYSQSHYDTDQKNQLLKKSHNFLKVKIVNLNQICYSGQGWGLGSIQACVIVLHEDLRTPIVF